MPPKKHGTIWEAKPHTIAKVKILERYLQAWFPIMGRSAGYGQKILYIDGFAGPGHYINHPTGSPVAALRAAGKARSQADVQWKAGDIHCAFVEMDTDRCEYLQNHLELFQAVSGVNYFITCTPFSEGIDELAKQMPEFFTGRLPMFAFIDPFGATGAPFSVVSRLLASPRSEVFINFDVDAVARIFRAGDHARYEDLLGDIFGDNEWRSEFEQFSSDFPKLCRAILAAYKTRLLNLPRVGYVFSFEMSNTHTLPHYHLIFASQHHRGLEKMKEAMKGIDQTGEYRFHDAHVHRPRLFRFDQPRDFAPKLYEVFEGTSVSYDEVRDYTLNETPFVNPKSMLKVLEEDGLIAVDSINPKRRRGTFNEKRLRSIQFKKEGSDGEAEQY